MVDCAAVEGAHLQEADVVDRIAADERASLYEVHMVKAVASGEDVPVSDRADTVVPAQAAHP